jgi:large subunit ribosomal protein L21
MSYAVINIAGKQYQVAEGETLTIDLQEGAIDAKSITVTDVLLVKTATDLKIGAPFVTGAQVVLEHAADQRGEKIRVFKYKAKSRYRKTQGFRPEQSVFTVKSIAA